MKINWTALAAIAPLLMVIVAWGVSIEVRLNQHSNIQSIQEQINAMNVENHQEAQTISNQIDTFTTEVRGLIRRIQNLEEVLTPLLVDYRVRKELEEKKTIEPSSNTEKAQRWAQEAINKGRGPKG